MRRGQEPRFEYLKEKKLVGISISMSIINNKTSDLWFTFMPIKSQIPFPVSADLFSMQIYPKEYFQLFNPANYFVKWAATEVVEFGDIPEIFSKITIPEGMYAVFIHRGANTNTDTFEYIFREWLPQSGYQLDNRPHFEILGDKYKNNDLNSEEEVWIPVLKC